MAETLEIFRTYNCRTESGVIKRGRFLDDWLRYGVYYGTPAYLQIHNFDNWNVLIFDYAAIEQGVDPTDYGDTDIYLYIAFGSRFNKAAREGGYYPSEYNTTTIEALREAVHREIDAVIDAGFKGIFFDECDTGYWDWNYSVESSDILKAQLQEYCTYITGRGGKSFINGTPYYAECGDNFLLESFLSTWSGNLFSPDWAGNDFFIKYIYEMEELGEAGGIPWTTGIYSWLYTNKYAPGADIYAHSYGDPKSIWQHDKQKYSLAGALSLGLQSWNYIEPTNQTLVPIWAHSFYVGAPLECPQVNIPDKTVTRKYSGAAVSFNEKTSTGEIAMNVEPDYWWNIDQDFEDIDWEVDGALVAGAHRTSGFTPDYLDIDNIYFYDDLKEIYLRIKIGGTFPESDIIPFYLYMQLDPALGGFQTAKTPGDVPYLHFKNFKAQIYLYGRSLFYWNQETSDWVYLYPVRYEIDGNYIYYAIRKETLKFAVSTWNEVDIRFIPFFLYNSGNSFWVDDTKASYPDCLPVETLDYGPKYKWISWNGGSSEPRQYPDCPMPFLGDEDELAYNQVRTTKISSSLMWDGGYYTIYSYTYTHNYTVYGYSECAVQMQDDVYSPHSAVIYSITGQANKKITQVDITGSFDKAWIFDRETGQFVGPDDTPDTYFTSTPFSPTKIIDAQDIYILCAHDDTDPTADTWSVSDISVTLGDWASTHTPGYDIALPVLVEWQSVYDNWKGVHLSETVENTYLPAGIKRGGINLKKDSVKGTFTVTLQATGALAEALETYDITNSALVMRRTFSDLDHSDPDSIDTIVVAYVDSWELNDTELRIRAQLNFHNWNSTFPKRRVSYFCPFVFKGPQCNYGGVATTCDKTLTTCTSLGNDDNFGGIPTIPRLQRGKWG